MLVMNRAKNYAKWICLDELATGDVFGHQLAEFLSGWSGYQLRVCNSNLHPSVKEALKQAAATKHVDLLIVS